MLQKKSTFRLFFRIVVLLFVIKAINSADDYVKDLRKKCFKTKRPYFCVTFRLSKFLQNFDYQGPEEGAVKLVRIQPLYETNELLPTARFISTDSEWDKFVKFLQRKLVDFLSTHGIAFEVPSGVQVVESRSLNDVDGEIEDKSEGPSKHNHHHVSVQDKKLLWWTIPIVLLIKLYFIKVGLSTLLFGAVVLKLLVFKGALWLPYLAYEVKRVCLKEGLLKEVWNGLWQKKNDINPEYYPNDGVLSSYNNTWILPQ